MSVLNLESLTERMVGLTDAWCMCLIESAVVCFSSQNHASDVVLSIETNHNTQPFAICWTTLVSESMLKTYRDEKRTTDFGAMCVALLLVNELTQYANFTTTKTGDGIDYWLMGEEDLTFAARLEISGIRKKTKTNSVTSRLEVKKKQITQSDATELPVYIVIAEFSTPEAVFFLQ